MVYEYISYIVIQFARHTITITVQYRTVGRFDVFFFFSLLPLLRSKEEKKPLGIIVIKLQWSIVRGLHLSQSTFSAAPPRDRRVKGGSGSYHVSASFRFWFL